MKYLLLALTLATATTLSAQTKKKSNTKPATPPLQSVSPPAAPTGIEPGTSSAPTAPPPPPSIYQYVEQMPTPGFDMNEYLAKNIHYPDSATKHGIQGRVVLQFVITEDGGIRDAKVVRGISPECDAEAIRVIKAMPKWKPGKQNGKNVSVFYTQPITFRLE